MRYDAKMLYGVDISIDRTDDWDKLMLKRLTELLVLKSEVGFLDIGAGQGGQSRRMALAGAEVLAIDISDYKNNYIGIPRCAFVRSSVVDYLEVCTRRFDIVSMQRVLHYLSYQEAKRVLSKLATVTNDSLFLSVTGLGTAIARFYPHSATIQLSERQAVLSGEGQELFSITAPLCLYTETELLQLLEDTGWRVIKSRVSDFGNIKAIAKPAI